MLQNLTHKLTLLTGKLLLNIEEAKEIDAGKRIISVIAGAYILQRGIKTAFKSPVMAIQEILLGSFLLYNGTTGINLLSRWRQREIADIRRNQIQGNDPDAIPAFV